MVAENLRVSNQAAPTLRSGESLRSFSVISIRFSFATDRQKGKIKEFPRYLIDRGMRLCRIASILTSLASRPMDRMPRLIAQVVLLMWAFGW